MKLQQTKNGQFFITLPSKLVMAKQWNKGDDIAAVLDSKGNLVLKHNTNV